MPNELGEVIGQLIRDNNVSKYELTGDGDTVELVTQVKIPVEARTKTIIARAKQLDPAYFVLDKSTQNVMDGNFLLAGDEPEGYTFFENEIVINYNNTFNEAFALTRFIDSTSTGTFATGAYTLNGSEQLVSEIVAANGVKYNQATITYTGTLNGETLYVSFDGGATYQEADNGVVANAITSTTAGIRYKIVNSAGTTYPLTYPFTYTSNSIIINSVNIIYS